MITDLKMSDYNEKEFHIAFEELKGFEKLVIGEGESTMHERHCKYINVPILY